MYTSQLCIFTVALLATLGAADFSHGSQWSRRAHNKAVARSKPVEVARSKSVEVAVERSTKPIKRMARRQTCKPPSNSTSSAVQSAAPTSTDASSTDASSTDASTSTDASSKTSTKASASTSTSKTSTSTSAKSTSTSTSGGGGVLSLDALFPEGTPDTSWTTSPKSSSALPLSDNTFNPTKEITALTHTYMDAPDGKKAMQAIYPEGSYIPSESPLGGISFYAPGPDSLDMTTAKTLTLGYSVYFEEGFDFNMGGKMPGLYGGDSATDATSCSGGRRATDCYSARIMWRTNGMGEMYTYLPDYEVSGFAANQGVCNIPPFSACNPTYGASVARGSFTFATGAWTTVSQRVQLNDVGQANGELQLWVNGESVINVSGLILRDSDDGRHRGIMMQTFFGGHTSDWASPKTQNAYFSDFSVAIIDSL